MKIEPNKFWNGKKRYIGSATLRYDYLVEKADESFYEFWGQNSSYPILEIIHEDDREAYMEGFQNAAKKEVFLVIRLKNSLDDFAHYIVMLCPDGMMIENNPAIKMAVYDVKESIEHYERLRETVQKYRKFMSMSNNLYFEYDQHSDEFKVYRYQHLENVNLIQAPLNQWEREVFQKKIIPEEYKEGFQSFLKFLRNGASEFHLQLAVRDLFERDKDTIVLVRGDYLFTGKESKKVVGTFTPINLFDKLELEYSSEARRDPLTGLYNKISMREYVEQQIADYKRPEFHLIAFDVDDFKQINDRIGHLAGDQILKKIADIINSVTRNRGTSGRIAGDQFVTFVHDIGTKEDIHYYLKTIEKKVKWEFEFDPVFQSIPVTLSIGVSKYPEDGFNYKQLLEAAQKARYAAKLKGKARYAIYDPSMHDTIAVEEKGNTAFSASVEENNAKKFVAMTNLILEMRENGLKNIDMVLLTLKDYFEIDGISVYQGSEWIRGHYVGGYKDPSEPFKPGNPLEYLGMFSQEGYFGFNNVENLKYKAPEAYEKLKQQNIRASLQVVSFGENAVPVIVGFDMLGRTKKWSSSEKDSLLMMGKLIAKLFVEEQNEIVKGM